MVMEQLAKDKSNLSLYFTKTDKMLLISTLVAFLICYSYRLFTFALTHDSILGLYVPDDLVNWEILLGRYVGAFYLNFRGFTTAPMILAIWMFAGIYFSQYLFVRIFNLKDKVSVILLPVFFCCNIMLIDAFGIYADWVDKFAFSEFLSILAVYLVIKNSKSAFIASIVFNFLSNGIYQVNLQVFAAVTVLYCVLRLVNNDSIADVLKLAFKCFVSLALGAVVYYVGLKLVQAFYNVDFNQNGGYNSIANTFNFLDQNLFALLLNTHADFCHSLTYYIRYCTSSTRWLVYVTLVFTLAVLLIKTPGIYKKLLVALLLIVVLPIVANFAYFISVGSNGLHSKYSVAMCLSFCLVACNYVNFDVKKVLLKIKYVVYVCVFLIGYYNILVSNTFYIQLDRGFFVTANLYSKVLNDLYSRDDFNYVKNKVYFCGDPNKIKNLTWLNARKNLERGYFDFNFPGFSNSTVYSTTYPATVGWYIHEIMRQQLLVEHVDDKMYEELNIKEMPSYPSKGYIKHVGNDFIVKLSDFR